MEHWHGAEISRAIVKACDLQLLADEWMRVRGALTLLTGRKADCSAISYRSANTHSRLPAFQAQVLASHLINNQDKHVKF